MKSSVYLKKTSMDKRFTQDQSLRIGALAQRMGISVDTIRYYEKEGLIQPLRADSGYRYYDQEAQRQLQFILKAKALGFSLQEVSELLSLRIDRQNHPCSEVKELADSKLEKIRGKLDELNRIYSALKVISDSCCGGDEPALHCSILDALDEA